ncbi:MAG: hypothetical protein JO307_21515 [Bryobacterales bacterium]|nr:hypothetical protein [Bryobacterales bacterium]MBV9397144.1 hypothetical protein [Bryobacterales bacterium]
MSTKVPMDVIASPLSLFGVMTISEQESPKSLPLLWLRSSRPRRRSFACTTLHTSNPAIDISLESAFDINE